MSRWKVRREWRDTLDSYSWVAIWPSGLSGDVFSTWREAQDYADRMVRTVEVVLPRPTRTFDGRPEFDFDKESGLDYNTPRTALYEGALDIEDCCDTAVLIPREHWRPLAAALWALAEQEEHE